MYSGMLTEQGVLGKIQEAAWRAASSFAPQLFSVAVGNVITCVLRLLQVHGSSLPVSIVCVLGRQSRYVTGMSPNPDPQ